MSAILSEATRILQSNWRDGFTIPAKGLYPFQWHWDSGFTAMGKCHDAPHEAIREIQTLFSGQWENGMVPHILFHSENATTYFPNHDFWSASVNAGAPVNPRTSGITQPPVTGFVLEHLIESHPDHPMVIDFVRHIYDRVVHSHRFLYNSRDPYNEGLFFIYHPWESGRDNSPLWDTSLDRITIRQGQLPVYQRKDTLLTEASQRPTSDHYDKYVYLLLLGKAHQYDGEGIADESPFLVQDAMMNAILIKSNESLIRIGKRLGMDTGEIEEWQQQSTRRFREKLWDEDLGIFTAYDLRNNTRIRMKEIGGLISLFAGISSAGQAARMQEYLYAVHEQGYLLCPSFDPDTAGFDPKRYWRGPVWPQMNWMLYKGLLRSEWHVLAEIVKTDLITLISRLGFYEYFDPRKSRLENLVKGYGGNHFSWTAAVYKDLIQTV